MEAFRLGLSTILAKKTIFVWVVLLLVGSQVFPWLTPWEEKPSLLEPARAQTAWGLTWLFVLCWGLAQAASFGDHWASRGILEYLRCLGTGRYARLFQVWASCCTVCLLFTSLTWSVSVFTALPRDRTEAAMWVATNFQYGWLLMLAMAPLLLLAISLGTRLNATTAYCIAAGIGFYGLVAIGYLDLFVTRTGSGLLQFVYLVSPHYHLADLTDRLVFKMGALELASFLKTSLYLTGVGCVWAGVSCLLYRDRK